MLEVITIQTGLKIDKDHAETSKLLEGPTEKDIVLASLEESMVDAVREVKKIAIEKNISMRMGAYVYAI